MVIAGMLGFAFYHLINTGARDLISWKFGIENLYAQYGIILIIGIILLVLLGYKGAKMLKAILG